MANPRPVPPYLRVMDPSACAHAEQHSVAIHFVAGHWRVMKPALEMALVIAKLLLQAVAIKQFQRSRRVERVARTNFSAQRGRKSGVYAAAVVATII
jgi:hypothetical protein